MTEKHMIWLIAALCALMLIGVVAGLLMDDHRRNRLMRQCLDDGLKEYQCVVLVPR